jgi:hypothetical protein
MDTRSGTHIPMRTSQPLLTLLSAQNVTAAARPLIGTASVGAHSDADSYSRKD